MMDSSLELVGNPISLLIERLAYFAIGIFFIVALYTGIKRNNQDK